MFIPKIILVLKMLQSFLESRIHKNVHFRSKHHFCEMHTRLLYWDVQFYKNTSYWSKWTFLIMTRVPFLMTQAGVIFPSNGIKRRDAYFTIHKICITSLYFVRSENDSCLGYTGSKNGWDTIKRFLLYWKIIRVDFPDACFCIISINCDSFVKTSNFINLRCTGNNHVAILYKNFLTTKIMPKILNDS